MNQHHYYKDIGKENKQIVLMSKLGFLPPHSELSGTFCLHPCTPIPPVMGGSPPLFIQSLR